MWQLIHTPLDIQVHVTRGVDFHHQVVLVDDFVENKGGMHSHVFISFHRRVDIKIIYVDAHLLSNFRRDDTVPIGLLCCEFRRVHHRFSWLINNVSYNGDVHYVFLINILWTHIDINVCVCDGSSHWHFVLIRENIVSVLSFILPPTTCASLTI